MANDPDLVCEVRTEGGTYRDWTTVVVEQNFMTETLIRRFRLTCAEPSQIRKLRLKPGDRVDIALAGQVIINQGYIKDRQVAYDATRHAVQIVGYGKAGPIMEASINQGTGQYRGYKLDAIANDVLKPLGIKFKVKNGAKGWDTPFPNVMVRNGETPFDLISRLCKQRNLFFYSDEKGDIQAGPQDGGGDVQFEEGKNILAANCQLTKLGVAKLISASQMHGNDSLFGKKAAEIQASAAVKGGEPGQVRKIISEMPLDQKGTQLRTDWEASALQATSIQVQITYQGWLKPGVGGLWLPGQGANVKSPMLFPTESASQRLIAAGFTHSQDTNGGTVTTVDLINTEAWGIRNPNAQESSGQYSVPTSPAQPDTGT